MLSSHRSTSRILSTLNEQQPLLEWFGDGFGLHIQVGTYKQFVTFRISNAFNNINWAGAALTSFLAFGSAEEVDGLRQYSLHPSRWFKLFFTKGLTRYEYEGPNVGVYKEIVEKLEQGICGADSHMPGYSSFDSYSPMREGESIASPNTFGVGDIFRQLNAHADPEFENCLIENLSLQDSQEDSFIRNSSWLDFIFENEWQIMILLAMIILGLRIYATVTATNQPPHLPTRYRPRAKISELNDPILDINVTPIHGTSFTKRLEAINYDGKLPHEFLCPISGDLMDDPVQLNDGQSYDYSQIMKWIDMHEGSAKCPANTSTLITSITSNVILRKLIDNFVTKKETEYARNESTRQHDSIEKESSNLSLRSG